MLEIGRELRACRRVAGIAIASIGVIGALCGSVRAGGGLTVDFLVHAPSDPSTCAIGFRPILYTCRPNAGATITDDNTRATIRIMNTTGSPVSRNLDICVDRSVFNPALGLKSITPFFRPCGGGPPIMNPLTLPTGATILKLEISSASVKTQMNNLINN